MFTRRTTQSCRTISTRTITTTTTRRTTVTTTVTTAITTIIAVITTPLIATRFAIHRQIALATRQNLALIQPRLHANHTISRVRFRKAIIDIGPQRMQRQLTLQIPFRTRDFRAIQTARNPNLNSLASKTQRRINRFPHRTAERHALFQLQSNGFRHQLCIQLRLMHFLNVDKHFPLGLLRQRSLQLFNLGALASDNDARPRGANRDPQLVARTIHFNRAHTSRLQLLAQTLFQLQIFLQQARITLLGKPA